MEKNKTYKSMWPCFNCGHKVVFNIPFGMTRSEYFRNNRTTAMCKNCGCKT